MFAKIWASSLLVLALCLQVTAHASVSPLLGVSGATTRADVQRPTAKNPCGAGVNIVSEFKSSTAVTADASGSVQLNATCFNGLGSLFLIKEFTSLTLDVVVLMVPCCLRLKSIPLELVNISLLWT